MNGTKSTTAIIGEIQMDVLKISNRLECLAQNASCKQDHDRLAKAAKLLWCDVWKVLEPMTAL